MPVGRGGGASPDAINSTTPTQGHFVLSPVSLASRDQDGGPVELNDRHLRSHGKIRDCEQSTSLDAEFNRLDKESLLLFPCIQQLHLYQTC